MNADPFNVVAKTVAQSLDELEGQVKGGVHSPADFSAAVSNVEDELADLDDTVSIVEANRGRYFQIDDSELRQRKEFIRDARQRLTALTSRASGAASSSSSAVASGAGAREQLLGAASARSRRERIESAIDRENDDFVREEQQRQQQIMRQQDEQLGDMVSAIKTVKVKAREINDEIEAQNSLLDRLSSEVDRTKDRMEEAIKRVDDLLKHTGLGLSWWVIIVLVLLLIGLIVVVFVM